MRGSVVCGHLVLLRDAMWLCTLPHHISTLHINFTKSINIKHDYTWTPDLFIAFVKLRIWPHMYDTIKCMLDICLTLTGLHHCVPEKKCFLVVSIGQRQQGFSVVKFDVTNQGSIRWQQNFHFLHSIITAIGKRGSFWNEAVLQGKKQTNVPALHELPHLGCYLGSNLLCPCHWKWLTTHWSRLFGTWLLWHFST